MTTDSDPTWPDDLKEFLTVWRQLNHDERQVVADMIRIFAAHDAASQRLKDSMHTMTRDMSTCSRTDILRRWRAAIDDAEQARG